MMKVLFVRSLEGGPQEEYRRREIAVDEGRKETVDRVARHQPDRPLLVNCE